VFFRKKKPPQEPTLDLAIVVAQCLPTADQDTVNIVTAVAGLLGCICYADRDVTDRESQMVRNLLQTIQGLGANEADAIITALERNIITISTTQATRYGRTLKELADRDLRMHVLDMMLDVATVDSHLSNEEVVVMRQVTQSLGLEQADYNELQRRHRSVLSTLQSVSLDGTDPAWEPESEPVPELERKAGPVVTQPVASQDPTKLRLRAAALDVPFHVVLVEPEIPPNTGNIARLCAATGTPLHLVGKLGFSIDEHAVRRAGLDYWHLVQVYTHADLTAAEQAIHAQQEARVKAGEDQHAIQPRPSGRTWLLSGRSNKSIYDVHFEPGDTFVFGRESVGLPPDLLSARAEECLAVPTLGGVRSLNLANSVSIVLFEALRQVGAFRTTHLG
jgi:tRNA (cytidine/uridine-2'-O-)-methyltransferase